MPAPVTTLTPEIAAQIVAAYRRGNSRVQACALCGVPRVVHDRWRSRANRDHATWDGTRDLTPEGLLWWEFEQADAQQHDRVIVADYLQSGEMSERGRHWYAERRWRTQYGSQVEHTIGGDDESRDRVIEMMREKVRSILASRQAEGADDV